jgi:hypothetical protein
MTFAMRIGATILAVALSGCFVSDKPLLGPEAASFPLPDAAKFTSVNSAGIKTQGSVTRVGNGYRRLDAQGGNPRMLLFHALGNNRYIVQQETPNNSPRYAYDVAEINGDTFVVKNWKCNRFVVASNFGRFSKVDESTNASEPNCYVVDLPALKAIFETMVDKPSEHVRYTLESF